MFPPQQHTIYRYDKKQMEQTKRLLYTRNKYILQLHEQVIKFMTS
jgi:hypothetical protein